MMYIKILGSGRQGGNPHHDLRKPGLQACDALRIIPAGVKCVPVGRQV